jgi:hypothetical protein
MSGDPQAMSGDPRLTRRQALSSAAAVGAISLMGPAAGLAAGRGDARQSLASRWIGALSGVSAPLPAPRRFALVGVQWASHSAHIELRTRRRGGEWSPWVAASSLGHGPDGPDHPGQPANSTHFGQPVWTGPADVVQLRSSRPVSGVQVHFVSPAVTTHDLRAAGAYPLAAPVLDAGPGQPPIIARAAWTQGHAPPATGPGYGAVKLGFVHHSETPNGYSAAEVPAMLRSIYAYHRFVQQWHDIGYNFAVDVFGRIWEARAGGIDQAVIGAQAGGYNAVSTGVVVLGSFTSVAPSSAALNAIERLLAWKLSLHGAPAQGRVTVRVNPSDAYYTPFAPGQRVSLPRVAGHRDGDSTNCPGDALYRRLPKVRSRVAGMTGAPLRLTISAPVASIAGATVPLSGRLVTLTGAPVGGETVEIQQLGLGGSVTLVQASTADDGTWSAALTLIHNAVLGAVHRARPAAVADSAAVAVAPQVTLAVDASSPPHVSGSVSPAKKAVTVEVYGARGRLLRRARLAVRQGQFAATLRPLKPGNYTLRAVTAADAANASGRSADVPVVVSS